MVSAAFTAHTPHPPCLLALTLEIRRFPDFSSFQSFLKLSGPFVRQCRIFLFLDGFWLCGLVIVRVSDELWGLRAHPGLQSGTQLHRLGCRLLETSSPPGTPPRRSGSVEHAHI